MPVTWQKLKERGEIGKTSNWGNNISVQDFRTVWQLENMTNLYAGWWGFLASSLFQAFSKGGVQHEKQRMKKN